MGYYFDKFKEGIKRRKLILYASHALVRMGIRVTPYYLTQEFPQVDLPVSLPAGLQSVSYKLLTPSEVAAVLAHPEFVMNAVEKERVVQDNCLCYALMRDSEVMSYTWCNLLRCHSILLSFPIQKDEAYLFGAYTYIKYRGLNLAPYLRYRVYQSLLEMGRSRLYSLTEYFNAPAKKFKKKLNARHLKLQLYIKLFHIFEKEITLKKSSPADARPMPDLSSVGQ
jgi:hypothetical protein